MGINSSGDMVTVGSIYRDDWGWVNVDDLVVGTRDDLRVWRHSASIYAMTDRVGQTDSAQITGTADTLLFILTPEPAPTP